MPISLLLGKTTPRTSSRPVEKSAGGLGRFLSVFTAASITSHVVSERVRPAERGVPPTPWHWRGVRVFL